MTDTEVYVITEDEFKFSIDNIKNYLFHTKNMLIKMNIFLDTYEINKCLTNALNTSLTDNKSPKEIYDLLVENWDSIQVKMPQIEKDIKEFNESERQIFYIDIEKVYYITYFKQITYVTKILQEIMVYLNSNINLIYIYTFLIQSFYNEPTYITNNYILFLENIVAIEKYQNDPKIKEFFSSDKIQTLKEILNIIYISDTTFVALIEKNKIDKIQFIRDRIKKPIGRNHNKCSTKDIINVSPSTQEVSYALESIENLETKFNEETCSLLVDERQEINIDQLIEGLTPILDKRSPQKVTDEKLQLCLPLWLGVMLFLYKKYKISEKFEDFKAKVSGLLQKYNYSDGYIPTIDIFNDLDLADFVYQQGGNGQRDLYFKKYLKYKTKYINLLKKK
jgi:hypothetical protein